MSINLCNLHEKNTLHDFYWSKKLFTNSLEPRKESTVKEIRSSWNKNVEELSG